MDIEIIASQITGRNRFFQKDGKMSLIAVLHLYNGSITKHPVEITKEGDKIVIKGDEKIVERLKTLLTKRDSWGEVVWCVIQNEYLTLDRIEDRVEKLQNASLHNYSRGTLESILKVKKSLFHMHRDYIRLRNVVETIVDVNVERANMRKVLRDVNEMIDVVEYLIDASTTAIEIMQNTLSAKMNEIIKILTIIATIMMPLTLITGIYGMNFKNMPEIGWNFGYYYSLLLMLAIAVLMLWYFKKKRMI